MVSTFVMLLQEWRYSSAAFNRGNICTYTVCMNSLVVISHQYIYFKIVTQLQAFCDELQQSDRNDKWHAKSDHEKFKVLTSEAHGLCWKAHDWNYCLFLATYSTGGCIHAKRVSHLTGKYTPQPMYSLLQLKHRNIGSIYTWPIWKTVSDSLE